jgi:hypothetical protein
MHNINSTVPHLQRHDACACWWDERLRHLEDVATPATALLPLAATIQPIHALCSVRKIQHNVMRSFIAKSVV